MFTGLIETTGRVRKTGAVLEIESAGDLELCPGDSLSVDGSCLTVTKAHGNRIIFDVSPETRRRTATAAPGQSVNLERPLKADGRLHGHFVTGHVDCVGTVTAIRRAAGFSEATFSYPTEYSPLLVEKGSVAVAGISLTVWSLKGRAFTVALIPETLAGTTAGCWKPGAKVNLEFDIIGKYVLRAGAETLKEESLRSYLEE